MKQILFLIILLATQVSATAQNCNTLRYQDSIFHEITVTSGIKFATATPYGALAQPQDLYLDIYEPANDTLSKRPVIVFQFGGGFLIGFRTQPPIPKLCEYFAKCGYVVVSIDYRIGFNPLSTGSAERAVIRAVQDQRAAVRHLAQRCNQYRLDTNSIFLTGTSAGCFAGLHSTFMVENQVPVSSQGILLEPADLGCMDCSGNTDNGNRNIKARGIINLWGAILDTAFIDPWDTVPVLSIHGTNDNAVPYETGYPFMYPVFPIVNGSHPITVRMQHLGLSTQLVSLVGFGHEPELLNPEINDTINKYGKAFLYEIIKPKTSTIIGVNKVCAGNIIQYSVGARSGSSFCWSLMGAGSIVSNRGNSIDVLWTDTGNVTVSVQEKNYLDAAGDKKTVSTQVVAPTQSNFTLQINELEVTFTNTSTNTTTYNWNLGDGTTSTLDILPTKIYEAPGTYTLQLITSNQVCSDTFMQTIIIDTCPVAEITHQLTNYNAFLNTPSTNTTKYYWNFGDGDSAAVNFPNVFHQYAANGTYFITLRVVNAIGCESIDTLTLQVNTNTTDISSIASSPIIFTDGTTSYTINLPHNNLASIQVLDIKGSQVFSETFTTSTTLPISTFANGIYIVKIKSKDAEFTSRMMKH